MLSTFCHHGAKRSTFRARGPSALRVDKRSDDPAREGVRHLGQRALRVDKRPDGLAREGVRHLGAWSKTSWSLEEDSFGFGHLGAWSKTSWSKKDDIWGSRSLEYAILAVSVDSGVDF